MSDAASEDLDRQVRLAAFEFLAEQTRLYGETLPWTRLLQGLDFRGRRVPLVSPPGIFKPAILPEVPLTIRTAPEEEGRTRSYADEMDSEGRLRYRYRGTDPRHPDNVGLRRAMQRRLPLIYLFGVVPGWVGFSLAMRSRARAQSPSGPDEAPPSLTAGRDRMELGRQWQSVGLEGGTTNREGVRCTRAS